jgi:hypothetical protein
MSRRLDVLARLGCEKPAIKLDRGGCLSSALFLLRIHPRFIIMRPEYLGGGKGKFKKDAFTTESTEDTEKNKNA